MDTKAIIEAINNIDNLHNDDQFIAYNERDFINFVNEQNVPVIYYQSGDQSATAEAIAKETGTEIAVLYDLESKPTDLDGEENLYLEAMAQNLEQLKKSIQ